MLSDYNVLSIDCDWITTLKNQREFLPFIIPILNQNKKIIFEIDHHNINKYFNLKFEFCNLYNIDHHHDAGYQPEKNWLHEGNWLYHLVKIFPQKINYTWVCNSDSDPIRDEYHWDIFRDNIKNFKFDYHLNIINKNKFDIIFICCSPLYNNQLGITTYKILESIYGT